ncbi:MAG: NAD-dependent epimerase/dehydratase family protein [Betaproteobacteria bacterium]|nr:NAD-dependent epimerase/dehydratase family protein [Betaproteobacteria bacterium]
MKVLLTGGAGFIGMHVAQALLARGNAVVVLDNLNDYYPVALKEARLSLLKAEAAARPGMRPGFRFFRVDLADAAALENTLTAAQREDETPFDAVLHLAAQAGVRYSLTHPQAYVQSNLVGFANILETCRRLRVPHLVYASSSSVYGANVRLPFSEEDRTDAPLTLYAATKKANEAMAHSYSHLYGLPATGLRFFTVYGPWGRPDMAYYKFTRAMLAGEPIDIYNHGQMRRDFTYVGDVVTSVLRILDAPPAPCAPPCRIYNVGGQNSVLVNDFIATLERIIGCTAIRNEMPMQDGDVPETLANASALERDFGAVPHTPLEPGLRRFVGWYCRYHGIPAPAALSLEVSH